MKHTYSRLIAAVALGAMLFVDASSVLASSWSPTLLVNTESFQIIDDGDGTTSIDLRFGTSGKALKWNPTEATFQMNGNTEIQGTASGRSIRAQDSLTSSGTLTIEGTG